MNKKMHLPVIVLQLLLLSSCAVNHSVIKSSSSADRTTRVESSRVIQVGDAGAKSLSGADE